MSSKVKNKYDYSDTQIKETSANTILEILPQEENSTASTKTVLIKHDYYSSDSEHGRDLLKAILRALNKPEICNLVIYLVDSGTLLLDKENPAFDSFRPLIAKSEMIIAADESICFYNVDPGIDPNILTQPFDSIAEDIILISDLLIIE